MKQINPFPFVVKRPAGGDDPAAVITGLVGVNATLDQQLAGLRNHVQKLWLPLAALTIEHAGRLRVKVVDIEAIGAHTQLIVSTDPHDDDYVLIQLTKCECKDGEDHPNKTPGL